MSELEQAKWYVGSIAQLLRAKAEQNEDVIKLTSFHKKLVLADISLGKIANLINTYKQFSSNEAALFSDTSFEILLQPSSVGRRIAKDVLTISDPVNKIKYSLGKPSDLYVYHLVYHTQDLSQLRGMMSLVPPIQFRHRNDEVPFMIEAIDLFKEQARLLSLRIESENSNSLKSFYEFADSFIFHLSYNLDAPLIPFRSIKQLTLAAQFANIRRRRLSDLDAPKRIYVKDLVYHYQMALASDTPTLAYLSFYHVFEHFFETIYNEYVVAQVQNCITEPDFSYKDRKDLQSLVDLVSRLVKQRNEENVINEMEALKIILERYGELDQLPKELSEYDPTLEQYYRSTMVPFSEGDRVDISQADKTALVGGLARRIYKTRNAIVHAKDNDKARYRPFEHDSDLAKEIPLIRLLAENVIKATAKPL